MHSYFHLSFYIRQDDKTLVEENRIYSILSHHPKIKYKIEECHIKFGKKPLLPNLKLTLECIEADLESSESLEDLLEVSTLLSPKKIENVYAWQRNAGQCATNEIFLSKAIIKVLRKYKVHYWVYSYPDAGYSCWTNRYEEYVSNGKLSKEEMKDTSNIYNMYSYIFLAEDLISKFIESTQTTLVFNQESSMEIIKESLRLLDYSYDFDVKLEDKVVLTNKDKTKPDLTFVYNLVKHSFNFIKNTDEDNK